VLDEIHLTSSSFFTINATTSNSNLEKKSYIKEIRFH
jgi:hypothetical protein